MKRRTLLSLAAAGARRSALTPAWAAKTKKPKPLKILILGGTRFIGLHMTALALEARPHAHLLQSRQDQDRSLSRSRTHQGRSQRRDRRAQGSRMGRGHRQLRLCAAPRAAVGGTARAEGEAVRVRVVDLGVSELQRAARRDFAGRQARRRNRREGRRRNVRSAEGAVRAGGREGAARPHDRHPARAHRRPRRQHRSLHLLARARGARRRVHRAGRARGSHSR